ncbi:MAG TPA: ATP-binding protein, partial [Kofleriaceae bacterium]|nr:ATP-binding protein [Kofleriaceae bacterium]
MGLHNSPRLRDTVPGAAPCDEGFRSLAEACPDAVLVAQDGRFVYANAAAAHVHGYADAAEFLARPMEALVAAEDLHDVKARITEVLSGVGPVPHECEYHAVHRNGQAIAMTMSSRRITFGDRPAVLSFGHDVSDRKRLERKLLDSDRMAAVGTLAAGVAHEVNNPLTYVLLNLRRLRRSLPGFIGTGADRELCEQLLDEALDGSERVRLIVKDLLELGRPTAPDPVPTQVATVVESAVKLVRTSLRHRAQIIRHYRPSPPILANPTRLGQVFLNLLINAGQSFHTDDVDHNEIHIGVGPRGHDRVTVEVRDNGIGIVGGNRERIFDPFFTTKPVGTGVGLGLTVARSIVESLGGQLALE